MVLISFPRMTEGVEFKVYNIIQSSNTPSVWVCIETPRSIQGIAFKRDCIGISLTVSHTLIISNAVQLN